jgi:hypothetical protein
MPPYLGPLADGGQLKAGEVRALVAEVQAPLVDAAVIGLTENIAVRPSFFKPAAGAIIL